MAQNEETRLRKVVPSDQLFTLLKRWTLQDPPSLTMALYLKAPHALTGERLYGSIVISPNVDIDHIQLHLIGTEHIHDPVHFQENTHTHTFLSLPCQLLDQEPRTEGTVFPFYLQLPLGIGSSYKDKKGHVQYQLHCQASGPSTSPLEAVKEVNIYQTIQSFQSSESAVVNQPLCEKCTVWHRGKTNGLSPTSIAPLARGRMARRYRGVDISMTLAKIIWISGSLLYVDMAINNTSPRTICDIQLDLIRRQNTFAYIEHSKSFGLLPVTSSCETIASTHVHGQGWWQPVAPHQKDHVTLPLEIPDHVFTIKTQKLMDISYSVRIAICSDTCKEELAELPILLVHKVAMTHHPAYFEKTQASVSASSMWSTSEASDYTDFLPQVEHAEPSAPSIVTLSPPVEWMNFPVRSPRLDHSYPICTLKGRHSGKKWYNWVKQKSQGWVDKQFIMASTSCIMQPVHQKKKKPKLLRACESVLMQTKQSLLTSASVSLLVDKSKKKLISSKLQKLSTNTVAPAPTLHHGPSQKFELTNQDLELYSQSLPLRPS